MDKPSFLQALLHVMERKEHWSWRLFTSGQVPKNKLHIHFEQEYATYVRDFPVMVGWAYVQCPIPEARRELVENVYEEETGGLVAGRPHPELFLQYPRGLGMDLKRFEHIALLPQSQHYRNTLDNLTQTQGWGVAAAVTTLFVEGTSYERGEVDNKAAKRPVTPLEEHPLVKHYGLSLEHLALTKAHRQVEGSHRTSAWHIVLEHVPASERPRVVRAMEEVLQAWLAYREGVAEACGLRNKKVS